MESRDVVVVGGGPAGRSVVHALHASGRGLSVTLIKDEELNVNRCAIPYGIDHHKPIAKFQIPNTLVTEYGAELLVDRVTRLDTVAQAVETRGGQHIQYRHLVLATGARPLVPPIPGVKADHIIPVRSLQDLERLRHLAVAGRRALVVGGGYIGVEVAVALRKAGLEVALVEMLPHILMMTTEPEFIEPVEQSLVKNGVKLLAGRKVMAFDHQEGGGLTVRLDAGESVEADFVVLAVGVLPETGLASAAGLEVSRWGIVTNEFLRAGAANIHAAGDCAEKKSFVTGRPVRGEFGTNAVFMGRVVAQNILGNDTRFPGVINTNASTAFEWATGSAGLTEAAAREAGWDVVTGQSEVADRYPMMEGLTTIRTKLVFARATRKLVGGSVLRHGHCCAANVDFLSLAIQLGATADDLVRYQYATHPELAAKPSDNTYVFACMAAIKKMNAQPTETQ